MLKFSIILKKLKIKYSINYYSFITKYLTPKTKLPHNNTKEATTNPLPPLQPQINYESQYFSYPLSDHDNLL